MAWELLSYWLLTLQITDNETALLVVYFIKNISFSRIIKYSRIGFLKVIVTKTIITIYTAKLIT